MAVNPLALLGSVGAVALGVVGGLYVTGSGTSEGNTEPAGKSLSEDSDFESTYADNGGTKYGKTYGRYMVGVKGKQGIISEEDLNKGGDGAFTNRYQADNNKTDKGKFLDIKAGSKGTKTLKGVCTEAYKETTTNGTGKIKDTPADENDFKEEDIGKYCSPIGQKPTTVGGKSEQYDSAHIAGDSENKNKLISVQDEKNDVFGQIRQEEFFAESGSFAAKTDDTNKFFKDYYTKSSANPAKLSLKAKCKAAYSMANSNTTSSATNPKKDGVIKYCSLTGN